MENFRLVVDFIIAVSTAIYGKQVFFYNFESNIWYSRDHGRNIRFEEVVQWLEDKLMLCICDD